VKGYCTLRYRIKLRWAADKGILTPQYGYADPQPKDGLEPTNLSCCPHTFVTIFSAAQSVPADNSSGSANLAILVNTALHFERERPPTSEKYHHPSTTNDILLTLWDTFTFQRGRK
jgi:hypothetical protein